MKNKQGIGLLLAMSLQVAMASAPTTPTVGASTAAIRPVKGVSPDMLKLQDQADKKEWCARIVEIVDGKAACSTHQCHQPFEYGDASKTGLKKGMRAIELTACDPKLPASDMLLWGPANLLILDTNRPMESGLWEQVKSKKGKAIRFPTEASDGTLSLKAGKFGWEESPE